MNWEDFKELAESEDDFDTPIADIMDEHAHELYDTGSVTIELGGKSYVVALTVTEAK